MSNRHALEGGACWRPPPCAGGGAGVGRLRKFQQISPAPDLVVRLRGTMELGGSHLTRSLLSTSDQWEVYRASVWSRMKSRHSGTDGQLRRRRSKPSAAYEVNFRSTRQPLRRGRAGGKPSMARPWSDTCGHAGDHGVCTRPWSCTRLWAVRLARPPRGDGGREGGERERGKVKEREIEERERRDERMKEMKKGVGEKR